MPKFRIIYVLVGLLAFFGQAWANNNNLLKLQKVTQDVYAIVGELGNRSPENLGNNATFGIVVTSAGVVLIDSGGTEDGAKAIDAIVKTVTNKPIVKVINTGGQDHRWLGNAYFKKQGAEIIASKIAVKDQKARVKNQFFMLGNLVGENAVKSTTPVYADTTFENKYSFELGGIRFEIFHKGPAHTPGDSFVWLPQKSVMFAGDIVFVDRLLGVLDYSNSKSWIDVYQSMTKFKPKYIIPGHGSTTDLTHAKRDTYDYLVFLRQAIKDFMDNGGDISETRKIDQSKYKDLPNYDVLSGRNAQRVYSELEWE
jgi:glyoxylase-like metal-dependent hydrolase (beta-lactamase superfamily II)